MNPGRTDGQPGNYMLPRTSSESIKMLNSRYGYGPDKWDAL